MRARPQSTLMAGCLIGLSSVALAQTPAPHTNLRFEVVFPKTASPAPIDGRVLLILSTHPDPEPRFQVKVFLADSPPMFGVDVNGLQPEQAAVIDDAAIGYPLASIARLPPNDYYVQAVLNVYATFHRADGHVVKMHMDQGEGQQWQTSPGNLISEVQRVRIDPVRGGTIRITLNHRIPPIEPPRDGRLVKHIRIRSESLSKFWGRDMYVGAAVLLPEGFETHPDAHYPVAYYQDHFFPTIRSFREQPPDAHAKGADSVSQAQGFRFYQLWTSGKLPRVIVVMFQDPNPYFDDSYAVNSANVGPYGDALLKELMPYLEQRFRAIGQPWARTVYGGSTGGWRALALQVFYPDVFNGTWAFCPDVVDFRGYRIVNIYENKNAYYDESEWRRVARPGYRTIYGEIVSTFEERNHIEYVIGPNGRSGGQHDIWPAVFGPVGRDGYYQPLYDKWTGVIDPAVAAYWREHYDLRYILERDWATLGPKLRGKIHVEIGDADNGYLNIGVYHLEDFLKTTKDPPYEGSIEYGRLRGHCYTGTPEGQTLNEYWLPIMADHVTRTAPPNADMSWKY